MENGFRRLNHEAERKAQRSITLRIKYFNRNPPGFNIKKINKGSEVILGFYLTHPGKFLILPYP